MARKKRTKHSSGVNTLLFFLFLVLVGVCGYLGWQVYVLQEQNEELRQQLGDLQVKLTILQNATPGE